MAGPLSLALMYTSIEKNVASGLALGIGIWISDIIYILAAYWGFQYIATLAENSSFSLSIGTIGSIILVGIGIGILVKGAGKKEDLKPKELASKDLIHSFTQGFAINTFNPVAIIFWSSVMGAVIIERGWNGYQSFLFFTGTMISIIGSDFLKIYLAKKLTKWLTPKKWQLMSKISAYLFIGFGVALFVRIFWN